VKYITDPKDYINIIMRDDIDVKNVNIIGEDMIRVNSIMKEDYVEGLPNVNVCVAIFTTSYARLELYKLLEKLQERCLYFDTGVYVNTTLITNYHFCNNIISVTDSVIFVGPRDLEKEVVKTGNAMGELKDELDGPQGEYITQFCSGGAKHYSYKTSSGKTEMTIKGITLNTRNSKIINFDRLRNMVLNEQDSVIQVTDPRKFHRDPTTAKITSIPFYKSYRMTYSKRRLLPDGISTLPFGYKE
jgi:hypothetical protein